MMIIIVSSFLSVNLSAHTTKIFFYKVLQPVSNQYNITDKVKEANQELYKGEKFQRSTQPKVRFRDHQLVDYEPEEGEEVSVELMEKRSSISVHNANDIIVKIKEEESSDDGYIEDEAIPDGERIVVESIEIEEVCEQIEMLETSIEDGKDEGSTNDDETYTKEMDFHDDSIESVIVTTSRVKIERKSSVQHKNLPIQKQNTLKALSALPRTTKVFRSKINPSLDDAMTTSTNDIISPPTTPSMSEKRVTSGRLKTCCQNKNEYKQKLPKYNGYSSNYGLSKDELERRRFNQLRSIEMQQYREARKVEQKEYVAKVNEEAFAKW